MQFLEVLELLPDGHVLVRLEQVLLVATVGDLVEDGTLVCADLGLVDFELPYQNVAVSHFERTIRCDEIMR